MPPLPRLSEPHATDSDASEGTERLKNPPPRQVFILASDQNLDKYRVSDPLVRHADGGCSPEESASFPDAAQGGPDLEGGNANYESVLPSTRVSPPLGSPVNTMSAISDTGGSFSVPPTEITAPSEHPQRSDATEVVASRQELQGSEAAGIVASRRQLPSSDTARAVATHQQRQTSDTTRVVVSRQELPSSEPIWAAASRRRLQSSHATRVVSSRQELLSSDATRAVASRREDPFCEAVGEVLSRLEHRRRWLPWHMNEFTWTDAGLMFGDGSTSVLGAPASERETYGASATIYPSSESTTGSPVTVTRARDGRPSPSGLVLATESSTSELVLATESSPSELVLTTESSPSGLELATESTPNVSQVLPTAIQGQTTDSRTRSDFQFKHGLGAPQESSKHSAETEPTLAFLAWEDTVDELAELLYHDFIRSHAPGRSAKKNTAAKAYNPTGSSSNTSSGGSTRNQKSKPPKASKRRAVDGSGDSDDDDDEPSGDGPSSSEATGSAKSLCFACPHLKWKPNRAEKSCLKRFKRISDLKKHLLESHYTPHCGTCYGDLAHTTYLCHNRAAPPGYITEEMRDVIRKYADRTQSPAEQWRHLFRTIFPGEEVPEDPNLDPEIAETSRQVAAFLRSATGRKRMDEHSRDLVIEKSKADDLLKRFRIELTWWALQNPKDRSPKDTTDASVASEGSELVGLDDQGESMQETPMPVSFDGSNGLDFGVGVQTPQCLDPAALSVLCLREAPSSQVLRDDGCNTNTDMDFGPAYPGVKDGGVANTPNEFPQHELVGESSHQMACDSAVREWADFNSVLLTGDEDAVDVGA